MTAYIDKDTSPHVVVNIMLDKTFVPFDCYIDTGFLVGLVLPQEHKKYFVSGSYTTKSFRMADGSVKPFNIYEGTIEYDKKKFLLPILFSRISDAIIGLHFLKHFRFVYDFKNNHSSLA